MPVLGIEKRILDLADKLLAANDPIEITKLEQEIEVLLKKYAIIKEVFKENANSGRTT